MSFKPQWKSTFDMSGGMRTRPGPRCCEHGKSVLYVLWRITHVRVAISLLQNRHAMPNARKSHSSPEAGDACTHASNHETMFRNARAVTSTSSDHDKTDFELSYAG